MTAPFPVCECGHPQSRHKGLKQGCRACDLGCARYVEDKEATAKAQAEFVAGPAGKSAVVEVPIEETPFGGEATSARLRRVEAERDKARGERDALADEANRLCRELAGARAEVEDVRSVMNMRTDEGSALQAELASARTELDQLRGADNERDRLAVDYAAMDLRCIALAGTVEKLRAEVRRLNSDRDQLVAEAIDATVDEPQTTTGEAVINIRITVNGRPIEGAPTA